MSTTTWRVPGMVVVALRFEERDDESWLQVAGIHDGGPVRFEARITDPAMIAVFTRHLFAADPVDVTCVWETVGGYPCLLRALALRPHPREDTEDTEDTGDSSPGAS